MKLSKIIAGIEMLAMPYLSNCSWTERATNPEVDTLFVYTNDSTKNNTVSNDTSAPPNFLDTNKTVYLTKNEALPIIEQILKNKGFVKTEEAYEESTYATNMPLNFDVDSLEIVLDFICNINGHLSAGFYHPKSNDNISSLVEKALYAKRNMIDTYIFTPVEKDSNSTSYLEQQIDYHLSRVGK
jgi:hypothetical protein